MLLARNATLVAKGQSVKIVQLRFDDNVPKIDEKTEIGFL